MRSLLDPLAPKLVLDCNYLCYQAFYTLGGLEYDGDMTGILHGFLARLLWLMKRFKTMDIVFCWDSKYSKRREDIFPEYKRRQRDLAPEQREVLSKAHAMFTVLRKKVVPTLGFSNSFIQRGYEADDLIASIVQLNKDHCWVIVSADADLFQLLEGTRVQMFSPSKKTFFTHTDLMAKHHVIAAGWIHIKCLAGCHSDGVPGIPGIGEKTASKYLCNELPKASKAYQKIKSLEGQGILIRNHSLVALPLHGTKQSPIVFPEAHPITKRMVFLLRQYRLAEMEKQYTEFFSRAKKERAYQKED